MKCLYTQGSQRFKQCEEWVMEYVCKNHLVQLTAFRFFNCCRHYKPSSSAHFTRVLLPAKYKAIKSFVMDSLSNASCCSLTTDMWTGCHSHSYMAVTTHIINDDWNTKSFCLATCEVTSVHTADNIAAELSAVITGHQSYWYHH